MSFNNRPRPNVSQYIANLNTIPPSHAVSPQQDAFPVEEELALFVNADFFDFDIGEMNNMNPGEYNPNEARARPQHGPNFKQDMFHGGEFQYPDFSTFQNIAPDASAFSPSASASAAVPANYSMTQLSSPTATSPTSIGAPSVAGGRSGDKAKMDGLSDPLSGGNIDEHARVAAEEDKRRRNTAASARFRVKKKQREQALERTAKEMTEKVDRLESRVQQLEMENKWLKGLITEKNDGKTADLADLYRQIADRESKSKDQKKDGVGTEKA